ncbi:copper chaperone PCu(A)C [Rhodoblastus sp.]|uniref:copper chaperone PCu(A)C n=1 Tax=Rhodoblastus sp. TaxID=1962975 RepID=UPI003F9C4C71
MNMFHKCAAAAVLFAAVATPALAQDASIQVEQAWARATPAGAKTGAVYLTIDNKSNAAERLTGATSDAAKTLQIHEMKVVGGVMKMREITGGLAIPANGSVALKPGGYHVMLIGLKKPLKAGETVQLTLTFEKAGKVAVSAPVKDMKAGHAGMEHMDMH